MAVFAATSAFGQTQTISEVYDPANGTTSVFYLSADEHVQQIWMGGNNVWNYGDLTAYLGAPLSAPGSTLASVYNPINSTTLLYYIGSNQHLNQLWLQNGTWNVTDLSSYVGAQNAAIGSAITAVYSPSNNTFSVFYLSADQHVQQIWMGGNGVWNYGDLTVYLGAPLPAPGSTLAAVYNPINSTTLLYYISSNQHLNQFWLQKGTWNVTDLSSYVGAQNAAIGSAITAIYSPSNNTFSVFYLSANQHVQQIWMGGNGVWNYGDLTGYLGAPLSAAGGALASVYNPINPAGPTTEVYYVGADQHVDQFWLLNGTWHVSDLSAYLGAPNAVSYSPLSAYYNSLGHTDEIYYLSPDQHVQQFWMGTSGSWNRSDFTAYLGAPDAASPLTPSVQIANLTHPDWSPAFAVGDTFQVTITGGAPSQPVYVSGSSAGTVQVGQTDANGRFVYTVVEQTGNIGGYTEVWSVGSVTASPAVSFLVGQPGSGGTVTTSSIGQTPDGNLEGVSSLSITNGVVSTYSATLLDYTAGLYYGSETRATLFDNASAISQNVTQNSTSTATTLTASANAWDDYDLQTDHYAVAFLGYVGSYENPLYWGDNCYADSGDCSIGGGGGYAFWLAAESIYVGSTLAEELAVPSAESFVLQPDPTGLPTATQGAVSKWTKAVVAASLVIGNLTLSAPNVPSIPSYLSVVGDCQYHSGGYPSRIRSYRIFDQYAHAYSGQSPILVKENILVYSGPSIYASGNWGRIVPADELIDATGTFDDSIEYGDFFYLRQTSEIQQFWASGFNSPPGLTLPSVEGFAQGTLPLIVIDKLSRTSPGARTNLNIITNRSFIGMNGDNGNAPNRNRQGQACGS